MTRFSILCSVMIACASMTSQASVPELELSVTINVGANAFSAEAILKLETRKKYVFGLAPWLDVDATDVDAVAIPIPIPIPIPIRKSGSAAHPRFELKLSKQFSAHQLRICYHGHLLKLDPASDHRDTLAHLPPMASNEGSFLPAGSGWYPEPGKFFTYRLFIQTSADQIAVAPGTPSHEELKGDTRKVVFVMDHPVEGIDLMMGPYVLKERVVSINTATITLRTYFHPDIADLAEGYLDAAKHYLTRYSDQIGAYPYTHFSIVSPPLPTGLGLCSLIYLGRDVLKLPFIKTYASNPAI